MKMIMAALAARRSWLGPRRRQAPRSDLEQIAEELAKRAELRGIKLVKERRYVPRQIEDDTDKPAVRQQRVVAADGPRAARRPQVSGVRPSGSDTDAPTVGRHGV